MIKDWILRLSPKREIYGLLARLDQQLISWKIKGRHRLSEIPSEVSDQARRDHPRRGSPHRLRHWQMLPYGHAVLSLRCPGASRAKYLCASVFSCFLSVFKRHLKCHREFTRGVNGGLAARFLGQSESLLRAPLLARPFHRICMKNENGNDCSREYSPSIAIGNARFCANEQFTIHAITNLFNG